MVCVGVILEVADKTARVAVSPKGPCSHCSEQAGCGLSLFSHQGDNDFLVTALNTIRAKPGDLVEIDLSGREELIASALVWGLPVTGLVGAAALGSWLFPTYLGISKDIATLLGCLLGLSAGWAALKIINRSIETKPKLTPQVLRIIQAKECKKALSDSQKHAPGHPHDNPNLTLPHR